MGSVAGEPIGRLALTSRPRPTPDVLEVLACERFPRPSSANLFVC